VNSIRRFFAELKAKANSIIVRLTHTKQWTQQPTPKASTSPQPRKRTQEYGFYQRYTDKPNKKLLKQTPRIYKGKAWYLKKGVAPMAVPGTSNHNLGIAIDIANASGKRLEWLLKNAQRFGFSWEVQSEPWHLRYVAGNDTPDAVREWLANKPAES
jgi:hypothetical protein